MSVKRKEYGRYCSYYTNTPKISPPFYFCYFDPASRELALQMIQKHKQFMDELYRISTLTRLSIRYSIMARKRKRDLIQDMSCWLKFE